MCESLDSTLKAISSSPAGDETPRAKRGRRAKRATACDSRPYIVPPPATLVPGRPRRARSETRPPGCSHDSYLLDVTVVTDTILKKLVSFPPLFVIIEGGKTGGKEGVLL